MDTKKDSSTSEVPTFKVARVGNDRKRKGGAFSFLRGGGTRGAWSGATGGSGAGSALAGGLQLSKMMLILLVSAGGLGAVGLGRMLGNSIGTRGSGDSSKAKAFSSREPVQMEGDISNLPKSASTIPNSLGYLTGSRDGLTPEERAKKEADAAAAAEAQRLADEEAAKREAAENTAGNGVNPEDLLASAKADGKEGKGSAFGKKFGSLTSSFGGGGSSLSGGAGLSGGVNRQFGGAGSISKASRGQLAAMKGQSRPTYAKSGGRKHNASKTKGFARRQLANANALSRRGAAASGTDAAAYDAASAFDNNTGAGNAISGPGIGGGTGASGGADNTPNAMDNGGPMGGAPTDCGPNNYQTADGTCAPVKTTGGTDANPMLSMLSMAAMALLMAIGVLSMMSTAAKATGYGTIITPALMGAICALGAIVTLLGVAMMAMGDYVTGGIATLIGGIVTVMAWGSEASLTIGQGMVAGFGGAALSMAGQMLGGSSGKDKAPVAAQQ